MHAYLMRAAAPAIISLLVLACAQQGPSGSASPAPRSHSPAPSSSATPPQTTASPSALTQSYGVLGTSGVGQPNYTLTIVDSGGKSVATATAAPRSPLQCATQAGAVLPFPTVSTSDSRLYYLDGNSSVKSLTPSGVLGQATTIPGGDSVASTFAVSPDDRRIAVVATDYSKDPVSYRIYVEDLAGGGNRVDIFSAKDNRVPWAMGWHSGQLVLGIVASCSQGGGPFSAFPWEYHVVDATNANRSATLGSLNGCRVVSLPGPAGALCQEPSSAIDVVGWDGKAQRSIGLGTGQYFNYAVAPSGAAAAACCESAGNPVEAAAGSPLIHVPGGGDTVGFIDDNHLLIGGVAVQSQSRVYVLAGAGSTLPVSSLGFVLGRLPGGLDPGHGT